MFQKKSGAEDAKKTISGPKKVSIYIYIYISRVLEKNETITYSVVTIYQYNPLNLSTRKIYPLFSAGSIAI